MVDIALALPSWAAGRYLRHSLNAIIAFTFLQYLERDKKATTIYPIEDAEILGKKNEPSGSLKG
ncbi:hypothetical protein A1OO_10550 [Enterovibrio norvegicus FF-33]|uniref:Uncharacterized protein n=1 Tax=Enterovibrio norvegicus FF-454 TaxID=1185651 RepID=A0A1E5C7T8_9GAMM|nr:hypothetical protein A1OK_09210 [Enterovibrio norvegicus FF-454]OEE66224.1 hypothetical protein A1OO_10550 [Enterovibrio norvegicus FF-33]OEE90482.1 hypothetical protein A1OQ_00205 [Enterovibrio norvegicus FF-162]